MIYCKKGGNLVVEQILWRNNGTFCHHCNVWTSKTFYFRWKGNVFKKLCQNMVYNLKVVVGYNTKGAFKFCHIKYLV